MDRAPETTSAATGISRTRRAALRAAAGEERIAPRKQPALRPSLPPPGAQHFEQLRREHGVPVLAALALLDPDQHAFAVEVTDLQCSHFGGPQPGPIGNAQRGLVLEPGAGCGLQ